MQFLSESGFRCRVERAGGSLSNLELARFKTLSWHVVDFPDTKGGSRDRKAGCGWKGALSVFPGGQEVVSAVGSPLWGREGSEREGANPVGASDSAMTITPTSVRV